MKEHLSRGVDSRNFLERFGFSNATIDVAQVAVRLGARQVMKIYGASPDILQTVYKAEAGDTPRTMADLRSGEIIKAWIKRNFPNDGINEEESDEEQGVSGRKWFVDPLDGTSSFAREQRYSTVGSALYANGEAEAAAICHPFERELLISQRGCGSFLCELNEKLNVSDKSRKLEIANKRSLKGGVVYLDAFFNGKTSPHKIELIRKLIELSDNNLGLRITGSNIDQQRQIATGRGDLTITDAVGGFYDLAPGGMVIKEAGGEFVDVDGNPISEKTQVAIGGCPQLVEMVLPILQECYKGYEGFK
jgi:fructose-1,6-bisphosphatase/inositol monophosphatase family enzyme